MKYIIRYAVGKFGDAWWCGRDQYGHRWVDGETGRREATRLTLTQAEELCAVNGWSTGRIVLAA